MKPATMFRLAVSFAWAALTYAHDGEDVPIPQPPPGAIELDTPPRAVDGPSCAVTLRLVAGVGEPLPGVIRIYDENQRPIALDGLLSRATALTPGNLGSPAFLHMDSWSLVPGEVVVALPKETLTVEAFHGLNSVLSRVPLDLRAKDAAEIEIPLDTLSDAFESRWQTGNCHLHLQRMTLDEAERYACEVGAADGYDRIYFSYLERHEADAQYISNTFTSKDLVRFSARSGVRFGYGEEYRHNFEGNSEGYGHVMFLDLTSHILPASLGYAITRLSNDDHGLRPGIERARTQAATVLWCHAALGTEDVPNWVAGLVDVQMLFDTGNLGSYGDALYPYLNIGLRVPLATGTDWFFRDMSMTCVLAPPSATSEEWLGALRAGRSYITNGPLLELAVNGEPLGAALDVAPGSTIRIEASALGRNPFAPLEILLNGEVVSENDVRAIGGAYGTEVALEYTVEEPCWIAARIRPFEGDYDSPPDVGVSFNEYGKPYFGHTSPIYVTMAGESVFRPASAQALLDDIAQSRAMIVAKGDFTSEADRDAVLAFYDQAAETLGALIAAHE